VGQVNVTLLFFDDCPNWRVANDRLRTLAREFTDVIVTHHRVDTPDEATRVGFRGSPTILIDGVDHFATDSDPVGDLSCRVFATPDGPAGSPTLDQLRRAFSDAR
jgi:glutaredoxin